MTGPIAAVVVAVPARDEADSIERCVASIDRAAAACGLPTHLVVAADSCGDDTAAFAAGVTVHHTVRTVVEGGWGSVGAARRAAVDLALATTRPRSPRVWIANTDGDGTVPTDWLLGQIALADDGADLVLGTVELDATAPVELLQRFAGSYLVDADGHQHVHAANLGIRASGYRRIGGWDPAATLGEEHDLLERATAAGLVVARPHAPVTTSSRTSSRVVGGFATDLARLSLPLRRPDRRGPAEDVGGRTVGTHRRAEHLEAQ